MGAHERNPAYSLLCSNRYYLISCDTKAAPEVAYLKVDSLTVNALFNQGTSSSKINTFWVEQNGTQIGAFIPPCEVPILAGENQEIRIIPGISINGSYAQRNQYEMLNAKVFNWNLSPFSKRTLSRNQQTFSYNENFTIRVIEDFDGVGLNFNNAIQSDTSIQIIDDTMGSFQYRVKRQTQAARLPYFQQQLQSSELQKLLSSPRAVQTYGSR